MKNTNKSRMKKILLIAALLIGSFSYSQVALHKATKYIGITTTVRNTITIAANQYPVIYNTTTAQFERYNGTAWESWTAGVTSADITDGVVDILDLDDGLQTSVGLADTSLQPGGALGTPSSGVATNLTGTASGLTAGNVTTNANLTGDVTSIGNATTIVNGIIDQNRMAADAIGTGNIINGNVQEIDLSASVNESLDLADSASQTDDQTASEVVFTPNGSIAATDVQAAIQEVRDEAGGGLASTDIDTFAELNTIVADKTLANTNDAQTFSSNTDFSAGIDVTGNITVTGTVDGIDIATDVAANTAHASDGDKGDVTFASGVITIDDLALHSSRVFYDNVTSGLAAINVQSALDELSTQAVNLGYTATATNGTVTNDSGTNATLPLADATNAGLMKPADFTKVSKAVITDATVIANGVAITTIVAAPSADIAALGGGADANTFYVPTNGTNTLDDLDDVTETTITTGDRLEWNGSAWVNQPKEVFFIEVPLSDFTTIQTESTSVAKYTMRAPYAMTLTDIRGSLTVDGTTGVISMDVHDGVATIMNTATTGKLVTIDAGELTSETAATAPVLTDTTIADDAILTFYIDVIDTGTSTARGFAVKLYYTKT